MSERLRDFTRAVFGFDAVVRRVPDDAWDRPSPCEGWAARDVVAHQCGVLAGAARAARGEDIGRPRSTDAADPVGVWDATRDEVLESFDRPGSLQRSDRYWFGEMTVDELIGIVTYDPVTHAWDLSRAAGLEPAPDERLLRLCMERIGPRAAAFRERGIIGEPVEVADDADVMTRYLGLVGRRAG